MTVDGNGVMLGSKKPGDVHLDVTEDPGTKAIVAALAFTAPSGWGIADGFPGLPNSYTSAESHPGFITFGDSVLYELVLDSAKVTGKSGKDELEFEGAIADKAYFTFLADPLKLPDKPPLRGTIRLRKDAAPEADLTVSAGSSTLKVGSLLTFDEVGIRTHTVAHDPSTDTALTRMDLDATLEVGSTDPVPVKLAAPFYGRSDLLGLSADFGEAGLSIDRGIRAFAELLNLPVGRLHAAEAARRAREVRAADDRLRRHARAALGAAAGHHCRAGAKVADRQRDRGRRPDDRVGDHVPVRLRRSLALGLDLGPARARHRRPPARV